MSDNGAASPAEKPVQEGVGEDSEVIALLRTPGLSIKYLDAATKERIRLFIQRKHVDQGMSLGDVAKLIGNKTSGYTSWLSRQVGVQPRAFEEARLKGIREKVRKYDRPPFDGTDEDRAYLLALRHGDLSVSRPFGDVIRVSTSTTHPEMVRLFRSLFEPHGHVYQHARYKKDTRSYEWNLSVILNDSFEFLLDDRAKCWLWVSQNQRTILAYLAGLVDAEGHISITPDKGNTSLMITVYNTHLELVTFAGNSLSSLGYRPVGPYLDKKPGEFGSKYGIIRKRSYWKVVLGRFNECQSLLRRLPLRHQEKIERQELALSLSFREPWQSVEPRIREIQTSMRKERDKFVESAQEEFIRKHGGTN